MSKFVSRCTCDCAKRLQVLETRLDLLSKKVELVRTGEIHEDVCVCGHDHWTHACQSPMDWKCSACECPGWNPDAEERERRQQLRKVV